MRFHMHALMLTLPRQLTCAGDSLVNPVLRRAQPKCQRHENGICENVRVFVPQSLVIFKHCNYICMCVSTGTFSFMQFILLVHILNSILQINLHTVVSNNVHTVRLRLDAFLDILIITGPPTNNDAVCILLFSYIKRQRLKCCYATNLFVPISSVNL